MEDRLPKMSLKFAPCCGARAIRKSKSLKTERFGRLFEVQAAKLCTTLWRESDLEVKFVKNWEFRTAFEVQVAKICTALWRESGLEVKTVKAPGSRTILKFKVLFAWQAQGFRRSIRIKIEAVQGPALVPVSNLRSKVLLLDRPRTSKRVMSNKK